MLVDQDRVAVGIGQRDVADALARRVGALVEREAARFELGLQLADVGEVGERLELARRDGLLADTGIEG